MIKRRDNCRMQEMEERLHALEAELRGRRTGSTRRKKWILGSMLVLIVTWAGLAVGDVLPSLDDLHHFNPNTPAKANQVNDNFDTVRSAIQTNASGVADVVANKLNNSGTNTHTGDLTVTGALNVDSLSLNSPTLTVETLAADNFTFTRQNCNIYYGGTTTYTTIGPGVEYKSAFYQCPDGMFMSGAYRLSGTRVGGTVVTDFAAESQYFWAINCCNF